MLEYLYCFYFDRNTLYSGTRFSGLFGLIKIQELLEALNIDVLCASTCFIFFYEDDTVGILSFCIHNKRFLKLNRAKN